MSMQSGDAANHYMALYKAALEQAAQAGEAFMGRVISQARQSLTDRAGQSRGFVERDHLALTLKLLDSHAATLCTQYPQALKTAFGAASQAANELGEMEQGVVQSVRFDQLELMDSDQVHERVALARSQQSVLLAADAALAELNTYICATQGMKSVQPQRNPLRPEIFVQALQSVLAQTQAPSLVQMEWLQHMSSALGAELSVLYKTLSRQLHDEGVVAAGYAVIRTHQGSGRSATGGGESVTPESGRRDADRDAGPQDAVLTLDRLRKLLTGELGEPQVAADEESFAEQFAREFESGVQARPSVDFDATVPAAFEALQEMKQVDRMMERIGQRHPVRSGDQTAQGRSPQEVRDHLRQGARGLGQALSLEVVALMVENIARDVRLLEPIREIVRSLEPALLRLALVDPRFFIDKEHPARRLLQEMTHRSLAYDTVETRGFSGFLASLQQGVNPLTVMPIEDAEPFAQVLQALIQAWDEGKQPMQLEKAVQALQHAEDRNLLAEKISKQIQARPDATKVPVGFLDFMCGPWAQVMAHARMTDPSGQDDPGQYWELVRALFWSVQPELTRKNMAELTRLVPKLLGKLREGLDLIAYPSLKTSAFFELLMNLHQQAFRPATTAAVPPPAPADSVPAVLADATNPWVAPQEASVSGFMELAPVVNAAALEPVAAKTADSAPEVSLSVGAWVELQVNGAWMRTQLLWASPHGTLFLFTSADGRAQSMTKRSRDKLLAVGTMRILSERAVVDGALDAVAQTAMLNSIDISL